VTRLLDFSDVQDDANNVLDQAGKFVLLAIIFISS